VPPAAASAQPSVASSGTLSFTAASTHRLLSSSGGDGWAVIDVAAAVREVATQPVSLAVVIDVSGSMVGPKMVNAKAAAQSLVDQLGPGDQLALVAFSDSARVLPLASMDEPGKEAARRWIAELGPLGATNIEAGLSEGERALTGAAGVRRLVLVSDGQPTAGTTDRSALERLAAATHERGVTVTGIGVGTDFDAALMRGLAQWGGGIYGDLRRAEALEIVLSDELRQARKPLARNVTLAFRAGPHARVVAAAGRSLQHGLDGTEVRLPDFGSGSTARVLVKLAHTGGGSELELLRPKLTWTNVDGVTEAVEARVVVGLTSELSEVNASRDEVLHADVARAFGNEKLQAAAEAMERGDQVRALSLLESAFALFGTSADALAGEEATLADTKSAWSRDDYDASLESKNMMKKTLSSFGEKNNAFY
jgi:Ca-activated chloride channel family protein